MSARIRDVRFLYSCADLVVYSVERGGAVEPPLTVLEAMSCGAVVAAHSTPATQGLIKNYDNGLLFSHPSELKDLITMVAEHSLDIEKIGENGRKTILNNYNAANLVSRYLETFKVILNEFS
jgi:glycosyltransferase involved in cell wall biosynthesis